MSERELESVLCCLGLIYFIPIRYIFAWAFSNVAQISQLEVVLISLQDIKTIFLFSHVIIYISSPIFIQDLLCNFENKDYQYSSIQIAILVFQRYNFKFTFNFITRRNFIRSSSQGSEGLLYLSPPPPYYLK